jgi:hypothetical protein
MRVLYSPCFDEAAKFSKCGSFKLDKHCASDPSSDPEHGWEQPEVLRFTEQSKVCGCKIFLKIILYKKLIPLCFPVPTGASEPAFSSSLRRLPKPGPSLS